MLLIYSKMLERIKDIPELKISSQMRSFDKYKQNDATLYTGWEYLGNDKSTTKESLENEIEKLNKQIVLNN